MNAWALAVSAIATAVFVGLDVRAGALSFDPIRRARNGAYLVSNVVTMLCLNALSAAVTARVPALWSWSHATALHHVVELAACFVVAEWVNWLAHWAKHKQRWLWTFHLQHHVERDYNTALTLHTHGLEVVVTGTAMAALLALCGFSSTSVQIFTCTYYVTNLYKHCSARFSLGPLDWIVVSPAYHRLHHAVGETGMANYGSVLTLWDVVLGTARWPATQHEVHTYGTDGGEPFGFTAEMLAPLRALQRAPRQAASADRHGAGSPPRSTTPWSPPAA